MGDSPENVVQQEMLEEILPEFLVEAEDLLESLNEHMLKLDEGVKGQQDDGPGADLDVLNEVFRSAHTLKGLSGMFGFTDINHLTHKVENIFDAARSGDILLTEEIVDVIFRGIDSVTAMIEGLRNGQVGGAEDEGVLAAIQEVLQSSNVEREAGSQLDLDAAFQGVSQQAASESETPSSSNDSESSEKAMVSSDPFSQVQDDDTIPGNYLSIFIDETETSLDTLTEILLDGVDDDVAEKLLVVCHRIKGSAASIGLNRAATLGHLMEDCLQELEEKRSRPTPEMAEALLDCIDAMRSYIEALSRGSVDVSSFRPAYDKLLASQGASGGREEASQDGEKPAVPDIETAEVEAEEPAEVTSEQTPEPAAEPVAKTATETPAEPPADPEAPEAPAGPDPAALERAKALVPEGCNACFVQVRFREDLLLAGMKAHLLHEKLGQLGDVFYCDPPVDALDDLEELTWLVLGASTDSTSQEVQNALSVEGVEQLDLEWTNGQPSAEEEHASVGPIKVEAAEEMKEAEKKPTAAASTATPSPAAEAAAPAPKPEKAPKETAAGDGNAAAEGTSKPVETVRVDIDRLDELMNLAGQLVINKARFSQIGNQMKRTSSTRSDAGPINDLVRSVEQLGADLDECTDPRAFEKNHDVIRSCLRRVQASVESLKQQHDQADDMRVSVNDLFEAVHQLDRVADGIQKGVMDTRMVPIGPLFSRFKRVVRDISRSSGKEIRLEICGEHTELDKRMIDELGDPLIHIVRNSADHGIESPEERAAAGKPREGRVKLDAAHRGNSIVIEVIDDGKGLDVEKIRAKAVEKGVVSESDAEKLSDHQIYQLIWEPGFSTAATITNVSGRGMGMDIVRSKIEEINGVVELDSTPGEGTKISIKLPLTLAILPSLLAEIEGDVFAVPVESVSEIVCVPKSDLSTVHGVPTAIVRGNVISVVDLTTLFDWRHPPCASTDRSEAEETILVIVESDGKQLGLVVDRLLGEEDIVIKSLAENYRNIDGVAGASILGDGRVSLILDSSAMLAVAAGQFELQSAV